MSLRTRLYINAPLAAGAMADLCDDQVHYLRNVLRLSAGVELAMFNGKDGEWLGRIAELGKDKGSVEALRQLRPQRAAPDVWLLFAPIKRQGIDLVAEKASELGASVIWPVITRHTDVARVNTERLTANAIEAAEQSERLEVPEVRAPVELPKLLENWDIDRPIIVCAEIGDAKPIASVISKLPAGKAAILIGPEGGFAASELEMVLSRPYAHPARLGPRILRAETAAFAALTTWMALKGDWSE